MFVADARVSNWWSSMSRSAWYVYQRDGIDRTCATDAREFMTRLQRAISTLPAGTSDPHPWTATDAAQFALTLASLGMPHAQLGIFDGPWNERMLKAAIWLVNHRGEIGGDQIDSIRLQVPNGQAPLLPRYNAPVPLNVRTSDSISCSDGVPVAVPSRVVPQTSRSNVAVFLALAGAPIVLIGALIYARSRRG